MSYQTADTYHTRTVEPERRDQKLCKVSPVGATGASLRWALIMSELLNLNLKVRGGHEVKTKGGLNQASFKVSDSASVPNTGLTWCGGNTISVMNNPWMRTC